MVISLTRLLASKSEVVSQLRKRLLSYNAGDGPGAGIGHGAVEIAMYMGDIQDHILTLQHSLVYYERMLSQSQPLYLAQLDTFLSVSKSRKTKKFLYLSITSICVVLVQTLVGIFSMNVTLPTNNPGSRFNVFGIIIAGAVLEVLSLLFLVRRWWVSANTRPPR